MKRVVLTVAIALCIGATTFAAEKQPISNWGGNISITSLSKYLNLTSAQAEEVANISTYFDTEMSKASYSRKNQDQKIQNAVYSNLKLMRQTLSAEQYTKYLKVLNITLQNKGIQIK